MKRAWVWGSFAAAVMLASATVPAAPPDATAERMRSLRERMALEDIAVGADGGIGNVVVFVRDKVAKVHPDLAGSKDDVLMDNKDCRFEPHVAFLQTGQTLILKNSDSVGHNSNVATLKNPPSNSLIAAGSESKLTFKVEEAIPAQVTCNIHPWMKAWVLIRPNPYGAISAADGSFEIKNLPAGDIELQLWHEKAGYIGEISVKGKVEKIAKGRKKIKVAAGDTDLGEMVLDANLFKK